MSLVSPTVVIINDGIVETVNPWDGTSFQMPPNRTAVMIDASTTLVNIGDIFNIITNTFTATANGATISQVVSKADFMRLFTVPERITQNALLAEIAEFTPADYQSTDPMTVALLELQVLYQELGEVLEVQLNYPETIQAVNLMGQVGIFGGNATVIAERISQVLGGVFPANPLASDPAS
jgi:hypothetical protein